VRTSARLVMHVASLIPVTRVGRPTSVPHRPAR
jgi:hypothetical protein